AGRVAGRERLGGQVVPGTRQGAAMADTVEGRGQGEGTVTDKYEGFGGRKTARVAWSRAPGHSAGSGRRAWSARGGAHLSQQCGSQGRQAARATPRALDIDGRRPARSAERNRQCPFRPSA